MDTPNEKRNQNDQPGEGKRRSTRDEVNRRVKEVLQLRLAGAEMADLVQYSSEQGWDVGERQLRKYVAKTDDIIAASLETDHRKILNRHIAQRRALYARAMAVSDYSTAKAVLKDEAELLGLYPAKKTELTGKDGGSIKHEHDTVNLTDEQRAAGITRIFALLGTGRN